MTTYSYNCEPEDADPSPFDCFVCGRPTNAVYGLKTRVCVHCDVSELRHTEPYIPKVRTVKTQPWGKTVLTYIDHSVEHWPSPA